LILFLIVFVSITKAALAADSSFIISTRSPDETLFKIETEGTTAGFTPSLDYCWAGELKDVLKIIDKKVHNHGSLDWIGNAWATEAQAVGKTELINDTAYASRPIIHLVGSRRIKYKTDVEEIDKIDLFVVPCKLNSEGHNR